MNTIDDKEKGEMCLLLNDLPDEGALQKEPLREDPIGNQRSQFGHFCYTKYSPVFHLHSKRRSREFSLELSLKEKPFCININKEAQCMRVENTWSCFVRISPPPFVVSLSTYLKALLILSLMV